MRLICNDRENRYYWVDANNVQRSPTFDYEADALNWRNQTNLLQSESQKDQTGRVQLNG
jgi:hypothetical protein